MTGTAAGFEQLSTRSQVHRLRGTALTALAQYPLRVDRLRLLHHGYNTTFRVDTTDGRRFSLRLNVNSRRSMANISAEMAWLAALARDTDLRVPSPQRTLEGELMTRVFSPDLHRHLSAALFAWLPGRNLDEFGNAITATQMHAVGRAAATMHTHSESWELPSGAELPVIDHTLMDTPNVLGRDHELLTDERRRIIDAAFAETQLRHDEVFAGSRPQVLHADLHTANVKWCRGRLAVFDFDDSGIGMPMQDLAMSAYYLRPRADREAAMLEGYTQLRPLPVFTAEQYEAMVASRSLVLLNEVLTITTADIRAMLPYFIPDTVAKLRSYLDTGVFRHDIEGLISGA
ncbi:MAG: hypothetical protein RLZZ623_3449 [Actinomycetota bacterium]